MTGRTGRAYSGTRALLFWRLAHIPLLTKATKGARGTLYIRQLYKKPQKAGPNHSTNSKLPSRACYVPGTVLSELHTLSHLILTVLGVDAILTTEEKNPKTPQVILSTPEDPLL